MTTKEKVTHTPGPWKALNFDPYPDDAVEPHRWCVVADGKLHEYVIATVENGQPGDCCETEGATARLIAAAPDLLAALKQARREYGAMTSLSVTLSVGQTPLYPQRLSAHSARLERSRLSTHIHQLYQDMMGAGPSLDRFTEVSDASL